MGVTCNFFNNMCVVYHTNKRSPYGRKKENKIYVSVLWI